VIMALAAMGWASSHAEATTSMVDPGASGIQRRSDSLTTEAGQPVSIDPRGQYDDGESLVISAVTTPEHGSITIEARRRLTYTPPAGFHGSDSFTYTLTNPRGQTVTARILVLVTRSARPIPLLRGEVRPQSFSASSAYMDYTGLQNRDGMRDGVFDETDSFHGTRSGQDEWIQADLGRPMSIRSLELACVPARARGGWGCSYTNGARIETSLDGQTWQETGVVSGMTEGVPHAFDIRTGAVRYVRLRQDSTYMALGDFRLFTAPTPAALGR
jgi:hypothetical protein